MKLLPVAAVATLLLPLATADAAPQKIMVFDFYFDNTSMEVTSAAEATRIKTISNELRADLQKSKDYEVIAGSERPLTSVPDFGTCSDNDRAAAQKVAAALVACGWVQKVSNLILNLNLVIVDAKTGKLVHGGSVDIRGNNDLSWDRGLRYLLQEHVFQNR
jgi:hypothetical protein